MNNGQQVKRELNLWEHYPLHKIWCNKYCPIVPRFWFRKEDDWNAKDFGFHWFILRFWTLSGVSFGADVDISLDRIHVGLILPYMRFSLGFMDLPFWKLNHKLYRKGTKNNK